MSKFIWTIFLVIIGGISLWYLSSALILFWKYERLDKVVAAEVDEWKIEPVGSQYAIEAHYHFEFEGKRYLGETRFTRPYFLNLQTAEEQVNRNKAIAWKVWVDSNKPAFSYLEKIFPFKKVIYAFVCLGLFFYFLYLRYSTTISKIE